MGTFSKVLYILEWSRKFSDIFAKWSPFFSASNDGSQPGQIVVPTEAVLLRIQRTCGWQSLERPARVIALNNSIMSLNLHIMINPCYVTFCYMILDTYIMIHKTDIQAPNLRFSTWMPNIFAWMFSTWMMHQIWRLQTSHLGLTDPSMALHE